MRMPDPIYIHLNVSKDIKPETMTALMTMMELASKQFLEEGKMDTQTELTDEMATFVEEGGDIAEGVLCDNCKALFNPYSEGHSFDQDDDCGCPSCRTEGYRQSLAGKSFCSPECEMHYQ